MATGTAGQCPVLATPQNDILTAENVNSLAVDIYDRSDGTKVKVSCYWGEDYRIEGSNEVTCTGGQWVPDPPVCVRRDTDPTDNTTATTVTPSSPVEDTYTVAVILISVSCVLVVFVLFILLITRRFCHSNRYKHVKEEKDTDGSFFTSASFSKSETKLRPHRFGVQQSREVIAPSFSPSLWSVPPSLRFFSRHSNRHVHQLPGHHLESHDSARLSVQATWRGEPWTSEWTYLSVDRLLRDIEASRKNNPHHSWRDFASLSTNIYSVRGKSGRL